MTQKRKDPFRIWTGFKFGIGMFLAFYFVEGVISALILFAGIIMRGLGFFPGVM